MFCVFIYLNEVNKVKFDFNYSGVSILKTLNVCMDLHFKDFNPQTHFIFQVKCFGGNTSSIVSFYFFADATWYDPSNAMTL